jgi:RND superfamily putative drug exporter
MLLPILNAIVGLLGTLAIIRILGHAATVPSVAPTLATMIGLGVGIDYALFIVTRHFRGMKDGLSIDESIARAAATSGGAVFFAGGTVTIALVSLAVAGIPLISTLGFMAAIAVVVAVLAALTLLPATLAIAGRHVNSLRVRHPPTEEQVDKGLWAKWANEIARYPWIAGIAALAILIPLTIPLLSLNLGQQDTAALSSSTTARKAYDLLAKNFGPGINGPLLVAVSLGSPAKSPSSTPASASGSAAKGSSSKGTPSPAPSGAGGGGGSGNSGASQSKSAGGDPRAADQRLTALQKDVSTTPGVVAVTPMQIDKAGTTAYFNAISAKGPAEEATTDLVEKLRSSVIPTADKGTDMKADVGGSTAGYIDLASRISEKLPLQILVVIALSFVLLILAFRTAVIPAQAAVMNLLSIGASYGVLTAIFQYGWLADVIGLNGPVPIVSYVPLFMFAVLFGLSMDYEVFLVSQIEEHVHAGEDNRSSVVSGLVTSARVITAAAAIMVFVFGSFVLNGDPTIKQFGIGLAVAVVLDATVVRCLLVPALMLLMGRFNWWMPKWLERIVPHVSIEGAEFFKARDAAALGTGPARPAGAPAGPES